MSTTGPENDLAPDRVEEQGHAPAHDADTTPASDTTPAPGRPVRLVPTPAGFWRVVGGIAVAMLGPLFGILIGSTWGSTDDAARMDPLYWGFFIGCVIGALGLVSMGLGAMTLVRGSRSRPTGPEEVTP